MSRFNFGMLHHSRSGEARRFSKMSGLAAHRNSRLTADEQRTVMTLWSIARSPLILGGDLPSLDKDPATLALLTNDAVLDVDQHSVKNRQVSLTADTAAWQFPTGMEIPAGEAPPEGAPVTTWDPPHRLVIRMESPDGTFNALDYAIEAREGGTAHLRYVHSGILADEWEDQYDAIGSHTDFYLHTLAQYLEHFNGRRVTYVGQPSDGITGPESAGTPDVILRAPIA